MSEQVAVRLECLKLALARTGANDPRPWREIADDLFGWVVGQAATAPAADLNNADKPAPPSSGEALPQAGASGRPPRASTRKAAGPAQPENPSDHATKAD